MMTGFAGFVVVFVVFTIITLFKGVIRVRQGMEYTVERFGAISVPFRRACISSFPLAGFHQADLDRYEVLHGEATRIANKFKAADKGFGSWVSLLTIAKPWSHYAKLLRKESLACEGRLRGLRIIDERIAT